MKRRHIPLRPKHWPAIINERPDDFYFEPDIAELKAANEASRRRRLLARLEEMRLQWQRDDIEHLRKLVAANAAVIEADRLKQQLEDQREERQRRRMAEIEETRAWFEAEHEREAKLADEARRKKLAKLGRVIARDVVKAERAVFAAKGLIRGRRK